MTLRRYGVWYGFDMNLLDDGKENEAIRSVIWIWYGFFGHWRWKKAKMKIFDPIMTSFEGCNTALWGPTHFGVQPQSALHIASHFGVQRSLGSKSRNWPQSALICYISTHIGFQMSEGVNWVLLIYWVLTYFRSATLKYLRWSSRWQSILCLMLKW
jgi:hypothetical protein